MDDKKELTYEEQVEKEFNLTQEPQQQEVVKDLGKVDIRRGTHSDGVQEDENDARKRRVEKDSRPNEYF